jgi:hypothetical protein
VTHKLAVFVLMSLILISIAAWGEQGGVLTPDVKACADVRDLTSADVKAQLAGLRYLGLVGEPSVHLSAGVISKSQSIEFIDPSGTIEATTVTCTAACPAGFNPSGCNPDVIGGQPACTALTCTNATGATKPGTCTKTVTSSGSTY